MQNPLLAEEKKPLLFFDEEGFLRGLQGRPAIEVFKDALAAANGHLNSRFLEGEQVRTLVYERALFMDRILLHAWNRFEWQTDVSLLAVGGYGRGELHPHSDIDLLILIKRNRAQNYKQNIESFLTFLWDIQLTIGQSVRSIGQCVQEAKADLTVATNLMECRTIAGDAKLREVMEKKTGPGKIWSSPEFFRAKREEQWQRHQRHGHTEYNLEPNVKEAPGGLRDIQMINWVAKRHFQVNNLEAMIGKDFINREEYNLLMSGEDFLWRVRYGIHVLAGRAEERLQFDLQRKLAEQFGYRDNEERLAVEQFMQRYYRVVLAMRELSDVLLQYLDEVILRKDKSRSIRQINNRFRVRDNYIETTNESVFAMQPSALLEIFVLLGEDPSIRGIRAATIRQMQIHRHLIDEQFRNSRENKALFLRLLSCPSKLDLQLQRMTRYGILGRYLPEFGRIVGQMQHDLFHIYPVDVHTIQVIRNMRRLGQQEEAINFPIATHVYKTLPKPELLFIAGMYHDIGKGRGGDHSTLGAIDVVNFAQKHGLQPQETRLLKWLVEKHLLMSFVSQREDIADPEVIQSFASIVGDQTHLDYLLLLTVSDINATNPTLWNSWKGSLLGRLYADTKRALQRGLENPVDRSEWLQAVRQEAINLLAGQNISREQAEAIWGDIDEEFFLRERATVIARCTRAIREFGDSGAPVILIDDAGLDKVVATRIFIYTRGYNNVFPITAATLDQLRLNIQDARLHTTSSGHTFDIFYVLNEEGKPLDGQEQSFEHITQVLARALQFPSSSTLNVQRRTSRALKHFNLLTSVILSNDMVRNLTSLEVISPDRPGLLAHLGRIFMRFGLKLHSARIATLGERVEDVFNVTDHDYQPLSDPAFCHQLQDCICRELDARNQEDSASEPLRQSKLWT